MNSKKKLAKEIFLSSLSSVMPKNFIPNSLTYENGILTIDTKSYDLSSYKNVYIYGSGKASIEMAKATKLILGDRVKKSLVVSNYDENYKDLEVILSSHPLPSQKSIDAGERLISEFRSMDEDDFYIYLLSGGSSALIEKPVGGVSLEDFIQTTQLLLKNGLSIDEINVIRKSISDIKGGKLGLNSKAKGVVLIVSDVIGDDLHSIGSAPLMLANTTAKDAKDIVDRYDIFDSLSKSVQDLLIQEQKSSLKRVNEIDHFLLASNILALQSAKDRAKELGLRSKIVSSTVEGDVKDVADFIISSRMQEDVEVLLFGGEPTVIVEGSGNGGRNQELALWVLKKMSTLDDFTFLSAGSDGIDGNSDAAGAVIELSDLNDDIDKYLLENDSYHYLKKEDSLIITGESGTNVMDIMIAIEPSENIVSYSEGSIK
jgi:hydroxypyruvate reductase/glycerate 2-kinase